jgi:formylglycine-generating enzyme required for sulfatase activity
MREYVIVEVAKASGNLQHPTVDRDNIYQKFEIGYNLTNTASSLIFKMADIKGGTFKQQNKQKATVADFKIGVYEVTQAQWKEVMGSNPSKFGGCDKCPVENVTWNEVQLFIEKLNNKTGLKYRLPSVAERELAARGGALKDKDIIGSWGLLEYIGMDDDYAWNSGNSNNKTHEVGFKKPNPVGIYDISGNVSEYTSTWSDPKVCNSCIIVLGGSIDWSEQFFSQEYAKPDKADTQRTSIIGFRLVLDAEASNIK